MRLICTRVCIVLLFSTITALPQANDDYESLSDKCLLFSCCYLASNFAGISFINSQPTSVCRGVCMFVCVCVNQIVCLSVRRLTHIGHGNNPTAPTSLSFWPSCDKRFALMLWLIKKEEAQTRKYSSIECQMLDDWTIVFDITNKDRVQRDESYWSVGRAGWVRCQRWWWWREEEEED